MGQTPTFGDHFAGRAAPGANGRAVPGGRPDHFKEKAERASLRKSVLGAESPKPGKPVIEPKVERPREEAPKSDAFAGAKPQVRQDPFALQSATQKPAAQKPAAKRQGLFAKRDPIVAAAVAAPTLAVKPRVEAPKALVARAAPAVQTKKAPLQVVTSRKSFAALQTEPVEVKYQDLKREEVRRAQMGRSSSLVLVTGSAAEAAEIDAPPKPAPIPEPTPPVVDKPAASARVAPAAAPRPSTKPRAGGGGGGAGGSGAVAAPRERRFTQDDLVGIVIGVAVIALLLLWMLRPKEGASDSNGLFGAQFAANEPTATTQAAPAPAPLVDPFGDAPVDLKPTGPIVEALPEPNVSVAQANPVQADPVPAAPVVAAPPAAPPAVATATPVPAAPAPAKASAVLPVAMADRTMNAWFCTSSSGMTKASQAKLEKEMETFKAAFAGKELVVRGYADTRGSSAFNAALGGERANVVADFLRTNGLNVVDASGIGELDGLDDNQNCSNQRRVDVYIKGGPGETPSRMCAPEPSVKELVCG